MTDNDDLMPVPDPDRLDHLVDRIDVNSEAMDNLRDETKVENVKRDKRIKWSRIASVAAIVCGVIGFTVGGIGIKVAHDANNAAAAAKTAAATANQTAADIVAVRTQSRASTCSGFEAFADALIGLSTPPVDEAAREKAQAKVGLFQADLETRLSTLNCHLTLIPVPQPSSGG